MVSNANQVCRFSSSVDLFAKSPKRWSNMVLNFHLPFATLDVMICPAFDKYSRMVENVEKVENATSFHLNIVSANVWLPKDFFHSNTYMYFSAPSEVCFLRISIFLKQLGSLLFHLLTDDF